MQRFEADGLSAAERAARDGSRIARVKRSDDTWLDLLGEQLPIEEVRRWAIRDDCGAVVVFCGTTRDHAGDLTGVTELHYEAYEAHVVPRLEALVDETRSAWPAIVAVAALHRTGKVALGEEAVVVAVSSPHRSEAFAAAAHLIDRLKATVPIWKQEVSTAGRRWSPISHQIEEAPMMTESRPAMPQAAEAPTHR